MINLPKISRKIFVQILISILLPFLFWLCVVTSVDNIGCIIFMPLIAIWVFILLISFIISFIASIKSKKNTMLELLILGFSSILLLGILFPPYTFTFIAVTILVGILLLIAKIRHLAHK